MRGKSLKRLSANISTKLALSRKVGKTKGFDAKIRLKTDFASGVMEFHQSPKILFNFTVG